MNDTKNPRSVLILTSKYEDSDSEIVGAFEDMPSLVHRFGEIVANSVAECYGKDEKEEVVAACKKVANILADSIPVLCRADNGLEWAEDECEDADGAVYGVYEETVQVNTKNK